MAIDTTPVTLNLIDLVNLLATLASLVLAVVAIYISFRFKKDADVINLNTRDLLLEIRSDEKSIAGFVHGELKEYGRFMRGTFASNTMTGATATTPEGADSENRKA